MYNRRLNLEINSAIMPVNWSDDGYKYKKFTLYPSIKERMAFMAKFNLYRKKAFQKEIACFLLSNYIAFHQGKYYNPVAIKVLAYGRKYSPNLRESHSNYLVGSIPEVFYNVVRKALPSLPIKRANALLYYAVTAFYYAPNRLVEKMRKCIGELKNPHRSNDRYVFINTTVSFIEYHMIRNYATSVGMCINDLLKQLLHVVCMSKKERASTITPFLRIFNLYRIMKQPATPFTSERCMALTAFISDEHDKKYFVKFAKRRKLSKSELLRKAVRAFIEVVNRKESFIKKIELISEEQAEEDYTEYQYSQLSRSDFVRSIYCNQ